MHMQRWGRCVGWDALWSVSSSSWVSPSRSCRVPPRRRTRQGRCRSRRSPLRPRSNRVRRSIARSRCSARRRRHRGHRDGHEQLRQGWDHPADRCVGRAHLAAHRVVDQDGRLAPGRLTSEARHSATLIRRQHRRSELRQRCSTLRRREVCWPSAADPTTSGRSTVGERPSLRSEVERSGLTTVAALRVLFQRSTTSRAQRHRVVTVSSCTCGPSVRESGCTLRHAPAESRSQLENCSLEAATWSRVSSSASGHGGRRRAPPFRRLRSRGPRLAARALSATFGPVGSSREPPHWNVEEVR